MRNLRWLGVLGSLVVVGALAFSGGPATAAGSSMSYTCAGGDIPSGTYASITVTGFCDVPAHAVVNVVGNINLAAGAVLDAQTDPSTITVGHNVTAGPGSLLGLGCQSNVAHAPHPCSGTVDPNGNSVITVKGNLTTTDADTVLLNGITVMKNVTLTGGGGDIPWAIKNNTIGGNFSASNIAPEWFGLLFSKIGGNVNLTNITATDPEDDGNAAVSVVVNTIGRNLNCSGLGPRLTGGAFPGEFNIVGGKETGQCVGLMSGI